MGNFLSSWAVLCFSRRTYLRGVNSIVRCSHLFLEVTSSFFPFSNQNFVYIPQLSNSFYRSCPSCPSWFDDVKKIKSSYEFSLCYGMPDHDWLHVGSEPVQFFSQCCFMLHIYRVITKELNTLKTLLWGKKQNAERNVTFLERVTQNFCLNL